MGPSAFAADVISVEQFFSGFTGTQTQLIDGFYADDAVFEDPFAQLKGLEAIKKYNVELFENIIEIKFDFGSHLKDKDEESVSWVMHVRHRRVNGGDWVHVPGMTFIRRDPKSQRVTYHRDYYDTGPALYENIPILGWIIRKLRSEIRRDQVPVLLK